MPPEYSMRRNKGIFFCVIFVFALFLRFSLYLTLKDDLYFSSVFVDEKWILEHLDGRYLSLYVYSPGYVVFLKLYSLVFSASGFSIVVFQIIFSSFLNAVIFYLLIKFTTLKKAFFISMIPLLYAPAIIFSLRILPVAIWSNLLIVSLLMMFISIKNDLRGYFYAGSSLLVFASLMRPNLFILVPVVVVIFFFVHNKSLKVFAPAVLSALLLGTIGVANYYEKGEFIPLTANGGVNFFMGNNPLSDGIYMPIQGVRNEIGLQLDDSVMIYAQNTSDSSPTMKKASSWWYGKGLSFIVEEPRKALALYLEKSVLMFRKEEFSSSFSTDFIMKRAMLPFYGFSILLGLFVFFLIVSCKNLSRIEKTFSASCLFFSFAGVVTFIVDSRYRSGFSITVLTFTMVLIALADFKSIMKHRKLVVTAVVFAFVILIVTAFPEKKGSLYFAWYSLGNLQVEKEDWDGAEISFSQSAKDNPDYCHAWNNLGMTYLMKKDSESAEKAFEKAVELEPENQMFRENLRRSRENQGR